MVEVLYEGVPKYGGLDSVETSAALTEIRGLVEKPQLDVAPSPRSSSGRYQPSPEAGNANPSREVEAFMPAPYKNTVFGNHKV